MSKKMLIVYYSLGGNTKNIAEKLQKETGADIIRIEPETPYEGDYNSIVNQGQEEVNRGYKPAIKKVDIDLKNYDMIAVGTPTWWYTMAPVVHTFLDENDFTGKIVIPFMTNAGWSGTVIGDMKKAAKEAVIISEKEILFDAQENGQMKISESDLGKWMTEVKNIMQ